MVAKQTLYRHEVRQLRTIQQRHLLLILKIKWVYIISNEEVLKRAGTRRHRSNVRKKSAVLARPCLSGGRQQTTQATPMW